MNRMGPCNDSSDDENMGLKPCVTWDFNSQPESNPKNLPQPRFPSNMLQKSTTFHKQINKMTSPLERSNIKRIMESKETGLFAGFHESSDQNNPNEHNHDCPSPVVNNREKMARILENLRCDFPKETPLNSIKAINDNSINKVENIGNGTIDDMFAEPFPSKEMVELFNEPNGFYDKNQIDSSSKLFKMKTSSPFVGINRKNISIKELQMKANFIAPPLLSLKGELWTTPAKVRNDEIFLDTDLDGLMENFELPSCNELNSNSILKPSAHQLKPKLNKSLSESAIEKKCTLLDDDLFGTDDVDELENQLHEIEAIATQTLNKQHDQSKNTIILCDKTDYSINTGGGSGNDNSKPANKCSKIQIEERRLAALQRLKSRSGPLMHRPNFYPTLNSSFKR